MAAASTPRSAEILQRLTTTYTAAADPAAAQAMRAYMRNQFEFLGLPAPRQQTLAREVLAGVGRPDQADLTAVALGCWALREREYQYFACTLLRRYAKALDSSFIGTVRELIVTHSWWDTVDALAAHVVGPLVARDPHLVSTMDEWAVGDNLWLARTAILHQLRYKDSTDADRLFRYCAEQAAHKDFFIRKAIGWALREYSRTAPHAVREFVAAHEHELSALSIREALRNSPPR